MQVARHVGLRAPIARLSLFHEFDESPYKVKRKRRIITARTPRSTSLPTSSRASTDDRRHVRRGGRVAAQRARRAAAAVVLLPALEHELSLSRSLCPSRTSVHRTGRFRPYTMCGCALDEWHPRYYSLHSEAASSGKELLGRLSLWRVQVDRGHRPLGAVVGLAPPARLCRGSRAVSRKLPTGQLPTGAL